jgi:hypothetical protein
MRRSRKRAPRGKHVRVQTPAWFAASLLAASCVRDETARPVPHDEREDVAVWDFPEQLGNTTLYLWPAGAGAPARSKRNLDTQNVEGRLVAVVAKRDPYLVWRFEDPLTAFGVHVEVDAEDEGPVQVFWATPKCPVFSESCSAVMIVGKGRHTLEFLLDSRDPLRELRLDISDHVGARFTFESIAVLRSAALAGAWSPNPSFVNMVSTSTGLIAQAAMADPWFAFATHGLDAARVTAAELVLRAPAGSAPQLFWTAADTAAAVSEETSARFSAVDAGELTHRVRLNGQAAWRGPIRWLRLDPGDGPGRYIVERFSLVRDSQD